MPTRRSIPVYIILTIVTCGLFGLYWFVVLSDDVNTLSRHENDTSGIMALLFTIITCNIYGIYWMYRLGVKVDEARGIQGRGSSDNGILYLILYLFGFGIVVYALIQNEINKLIE